MLSWCSKSCLDDWLWNGMNFGSVFWLKGNALYSDLSHLVESYPQSPNVTKAEIEILGVFENLIFHNDV